MLFFCIHQVTIFQLILLLLLLLLIDSLIGVGLSQILMEGKFHAGTHVRNLKYV